MDFVCKNGALWGKMLASANAKMQKPRVKRALCLAGAGAGKVRLGVFGLSLSAFVAWNPRARF